LVRQRDDLSERHVGDVSPRREPVNSERATPTSPSPALVGLDQLFTFCSYACPSSQANHVKSCGCPISFTLRPPLSLYSALSLRLRRSQPLRFGHCGRRPTLGRNSALPNLRGSGWRPRHASRRCETCLPAAKPSCSAPSTNASIRLLTISVNR